MKLTITEDFTYWHGGCRRVDYVAGQEVETDDQEMIAVAVAEGWATDGAPKDYVAGQEVETDDQEMIAVAVAEGWATDGAPKEKAAKPPSNKAHKAAPENK